MGRLADLIAKENITSSERRELLSLTEQMEGILASLDIVDPSGQSTFRGPTRFNREAIHNSKILIGGHRSTAADIVLNPDGSAVFNEQGADADFRIEGDSVTDVFKVDAGKDVAYFRGIGARVYNDGNISIDDATPTALTFNQERYDTDTIHSTSSNTGRLTATTAGIYDIDATASFASNSTGKREMSIRLNGTTNIAQINRTALNGDQTQMHISTHYELAATNYIELIVTQNSTGALNIAANGNYSPEFMMVKVG
jgi:hypothetical protein